MTIQRRDLLAAGLAAAAFPAIGQTQALRYYNLNAFSGNFANSGKLSELGVRLAVKEQSHRLGRAIEYTNIDTEGNPATAVRKVQQAIDKEQARFFGGGALSSEALAIMKDVERANGVYFTYVGADEVTGKSCSRNTFRWCLPTFGAVNTVLRPLIAQNPKWKRFYTITGQYVFGEGLLSNAKSVLQESNLEHTGNSYHALNEKEFSGYLGNAMSSGADVLLVLNFGANTLDLLRQAASFGIKKKMAVVVAWFSGLDTFQALGADVTEDMHFGVQYWHTQDAPANKAFVHAYRTEYKHTPRFISAADYQVATLTLDAIRRAGSTEGPAVVKALENHSYQGLTGDEQIRGFDHQVIKDYLLLRGKKKSAMKDADDFGAIIYSSRAVVTRGDSDCKFA